MAKQAAEDFERGLFYVRVTFLANLRAQTGQAPVPHHQVNQVFENDVAAFARMLLRSARRRHQHFDGGASIENHSLVSVLQAPDDCVDVAVLNLDQMPAMWPTLPESLQAHEGPLN